MTGAGEGAAAGYMASGYRPDQELQGMTRTELADRLVGVIDDLIPHSSADDVAATASILMAATSALGGNLLLPLAKQAWHVLDQFQAGKIVARRRPWETERHREGERPASDRAERSLQIWPPAVVPGKPRSNRANVADCWSELVRVWGENQKLRDQAFETVTRARRLCSEARRIIAK